MLINQKNDIYGTEKEMQRFSFFVFFGFFFFFMKTNSLHKTVLSFIFILLTLHYTQNV